MANMVPTPLVDVVTLIEKPYALHFMITASRESLQYGAMNREYWHHIPGPAFTTIGRPIAAARHGKLHWSTHNPPPNVINKSEVKKLIRIANVNFKAIFAYTCRTKFSVSISGSVNDEFPNLTIHVLSR